MKTYCGPLIALCSTTLYALLAPLIKKSNQQLQPFTVMAISMCTLSLIALTISLIFEKSYQLKFIEYKPSIIAALIVGIVNVIAFWLMVKAFAYMPIWQQSLFNLLGVILAGVFASLILGEPFNPRVFLSLIVMGLGLWISFK